MIPQRLQADQRAPVARPRAAAHNRALHPSPAHRAASILTSMPLAPLLPHAWRCACVGMALALVAGRPVHAQQAKAAERPEELIDWYYSAALGTGFYQSGDRSVTVLQLPLAYRLPAASDAATVFTLKLPVSLGFYDLDLGNIAGGDLPERVSTLSVLPGIEARVRLGPGFVATPFAFVGYGRETDGRDSAVLYNIGLKMRWNAPARSRFNVGVALNHAAYRTPGGPTRPLTQLAVGLDTAFPTNGHIDGVPADLGLHLIHYRYLTPLDYPRADDLSNDLRGEFEFAVSIGTREPVKLKLFDRHVLDFNMVGVAFRLGEVQAIRLFFSLPY